MGGSASNGAAGGTSRLFTVAFWLAVSATLSRVLGYGREAVMSRMLGVSPEVDAYRAAFFLPDMLFYFLAGGAVGIAFIPLYTKVQREQGDEAASRLLAVVLGTTLAFAGVATLALFLAADWLLPLLYDEFTPETQQLTIRLTRIVMPAQLCFIAGGIVRGALMARGHFASQAVAPLLYNLAIIVGGVALGGSLGAEGFAWGALVGAIVGPLGASLVEAWRTSEVRVGLRFAPTDPGFRRYIILALPIMLGLSLLTVDEWYDRYFGQFHGEGAVAALGYARLLLQLPVGIIGQALATAALPFFTRLATEGRLDELNDQVERALAAGIGLAIFAGAAYLALASPIVALLYQGGRFDASDTAEVAGLLAIFAWAVPAWVAQQVVVRAFYARSDMWRPMLLGTAVAVAAAWLYVDLGRRHGAPGLAAAGAIGMSVNAIATLVLARVVHGAPRFAPLASSWLRSTIVAAAAASMAAWTPVPDLGLAASGWSVPATAAFELAVRGLVFAVVALAGVAAIGDPPVRAALLRLARRGGR